MNEDDVLNENTADIAEPAVYAEAFTESAAEVLPETEDDDGVIEASHDDDASESENGGDDTELSAENISDGEKRSLLANPMFLTFAKGKTQSLEELINDFRDMLSLGGQLKIPPLSIATPSHGAASPDYALSERQKRIAREAGMSYREYYGFLKTMKTR